ncbi:hypothetical protein PENSPDRAFT_738253 [Peniophora sp. CONT]|nr:hypothetical protein PENSPDRAFT_738253 [Peniophora sp. CONT]
MIGSQNSANTPSPPMPFTVAAAQPDSTDGGLVNAHEYLTPEERKEREELKARLRERVAYQQMARNLRAKLQYAAYKVRHNVAHLTFEELEASARQETAAARVPNPNTQARAFVAAATAAANGDPANLQRRGSMAPPSTIPAGAATSNLRGPPRSATDGANATQSLYASILAQPPPRRARTIHNADTQPAPAPSSSKQSGSSRTRKDRHRGDEDHTPVAERTRKGKASEATASGSGSKRKAPASTSRSKASKRKRSDDAAVASRDDDQDLQAAATLTDLFRNSRSSFNAGNVQSPLSQASHVSDHTDAVAGQSSLGYQQSSARTQPGTSPLIQSATAAPAHGSPTTPPRGEAPPIQRTATAGSSAAASTVSSSQHLTATGSSSTGPVDQEAVKLLYYLHESPSPARPQVGVTPRERDAHDAAAFRALAGKNVASGSDVQANGRVLFPGEEARPASAASGNAATSDSVRHGSTGARSPAPGMERLPPHARKHGQEPTVVVDPPSPSRDVEMRDADAPPPTMRVTPPTPTAPVPKAASPPREDALPQAGPSSLTGTVYATGPSYTRASVEAA